jgi:succinate dehydrogenase (ubiquinone) cytochrome b560 subunit
MKMALSTLKYAWRPLLSESGFIIVTRCAAPMATTAHEEMKKFWDKNQKLNRPSSPWIIYRPHLPMMTSLTHRTTGIIMGVVLYTFSVGVFLAPGDFTSYIEMVKNLQLSPVTLFTAKSLMAFPLVYHYMNGIRHLSWDAGKGFEMKTQYKTGWTIVITACSVSALLASLSYLV